jgi:filamentous hemagglutinin family protein
VVGSPARNLLHSFGQFNVQTGESATFTGSGSIASIISRVTGGQRSLIDGLIDSRSAMPSANFFLLNRSGVLFGPHATLDSGGPSCHFPKAFPQGFLKTFPPL